MQYAKSLSAVGQNELELSGIRSKDLALLKENRFRIPDVFVILGSTFETLVDANNLKYKIDYILRHVSSNSPQSYVNAYTSVRKTIKSAKMPDQIEKELRELYEGLTAEGIGLKSGQPATTRMILSPNTPMDPENNDTIIQNIQNWEEFQVAVREAWALAYHPHQLKPRMDAGFPEKNLRLAIIVQVMDSPVTCCHAYSCLPDVQDKLFLQTYYGHLDLRNKVTKDYYALARHGLQIVASEVREQPEILEFNDKGELCVVPLGTKTAQDRVISRVLQEIARQTKKAEKILNAPVKLFFTMKNEQVTLVWANRLGFSMKHPSALEAEAETPNEDKYVELEPGIEELSEEEYVEIQPKKSSEEPFVQDEEVKETEPEKIIMEAPTEQAQPSTDLENSLKQAIVVIEGKYAEHFSGKDRLSRMVKRLNGKNVFPRPLNREILALANRHVHEIGFELGPDQMKRALTEISYVLENS